VLDILVSLCSLYISFGSVCSCSLFYLAEAGDSYGAPADESYGAPADDSYGAPGKLNE
jgi:hypothetical protein